MHILSKMSMNHLSWQRILPSLLIAVPALVILVEILYRSPFVRYIADDYDRVAKVYNLGWYGAQLDWYMTWEGRYSSTAIISLLSLTGIGAVQWLPMVTILIWLGGLIWLSQQLARMAGLQHTLLPSIALSLLVLCSTIVINPQPGQTLFWFTGNQTYTFPLVVITYVAGMGIYLINQAQRHHFNWRTYWASTNIRLGIAGSTIAVFLASGMNETHTLVQLLLIGLAIFSLLIIGISHRAVATCLLPTAVAWLAVSVVGLLIMILAPGNQVRDSLYQTSPSLAETIIASLQGINQYIVVDSPLVWVAYLAMATVCLLLVVLQSTKPARLTTMFVYQKICASVITLVVAYGLMLAHYAPGYYVQHFATEARTYAPAAYVLVLAVVAVSWQLSQVLHAALYSSDRVRMVLPTILISLLVLWSFRLYTAEIATRWQTIVRDSPSWQSYAHDWDARHQWLLQQVAEGQKSVIVDPLIGHTFGLEEITQDPNHWVNRKVSDLYGLESIAAE